MKLLLSLSIFLFCITASAQLQKNYTTYTVDNGLAQNTVWGALQDYRGYMWFGSADGLNRFDGYTMKTYKNAANDKGSILGTTGFNFLEDSAKTLWIGHDKGLSKYNRIYDKFENVLVNPEGISIMGFDSNGILWLVSAAKYIYGFDPNLAKVKHSIFINKRWHNSYGSIITSVRMGDLFFIGFSENSFVSFNPYALKFKSFYPTIPFNSTIHKLDESRFASFLYNRAIVFKVISDSISVSTIKYNFKDSNSFIFSGGKLINNKLYLSGVQGLFVFDSQTLQLEEIVNQFADKVDDSYIYLQNIETDRSGNIYYCSNGGGIYVYSPFKNKFKHYTNHSPRKSLFKSIVKTSSNKIIAGSFAGALTIFEPDGKFKVVKFPFAEANENIGGLYNLSNEEVLLAFYRKLIKYNHKTGALEHLKVNTKYISSNYPYFLKVGSELWLNRNNPDDACILDVFTDRKVLEIRNNTITCFTHLNADLLLIGTRKGLFQYSFSRKQLLKVGISDFVKSICITSRGNIFIGTIVGLFELDASLRQLNYFSTDNGLSNNFIYGILEDNFGKLWFSHNKGISSYHPKLKKFKHYSVKDGLQSNEFNTGAYYKDEKGLLYFGGVNGVNVIDPSQIIENKNPPAISINQIMLGDLPLLSDTAYNEITQLNFSYLDNTLSFDFSALEFSQPEENTYQYILEGYDKNWIQSGTRHFARYANLPPGNYVFKVKAANGDGYWNEVPRKLPIVITPPYWQTNWFYGLMAFLGISTLALVFYFYSKRQQEKLRRELEVQQKLEQERLRISRDLHDNVGAQLSFLITNIEWMLLHPEKIGKDEEKKRLESLSDAGKNAILTLRQTIWAISHTSLSIDDFADRFKQFVLKMLEFDKSIQVHFSEEIFGNKELSPAVALNMFRVCQEAFNNCLKHAQAKNIYIHFQSNDSFVFSFTIKDDGIGFNWDQAKLKGHYGLVNMQARAKETQAELLVDSALGCGTSLTIYLK